jgi:cyclin B
MLISVIPFCHGQSKSAEAEPQTHTMAKYFMELTIPHYDMTTKYKPSQIAAASLCLAQKMLTCGEWVCRARP